MNSRVSREQALKMLGLKEGYTESELKSNYRRLLKVYHPDTGGSHDDFIRLQLANELLLTQRNPGPVFATVSQDTSNEPSLKSKDPEHSSHKGVKALILEKLRSRVRGYVDKLIALIVFKGYLQLSYLSQLIVFIFLFNLSTSNITSTLFLLLWFLLTNLSAFMIIAFFHIRRLFTFVKLDRLSPRVLRLIRGIALLLYPILTAAGLMLFLSFLAIFTLLQSIF